MSGFYRKFIENYSQEVVPLCGLLKKNVSFSWSLECEDAFQFLKQQLENPSMLHYPDFAKPFILQTDASEFATGYVLSQEDNKQLLPIRFGGRVLTPTEKRYSPTKRELLAIFDSVKKERIYLKGNGFICYTDHQPLTHLQTSKEILNKHYRWIEYLQELGTIIRYLPRKENVVADCISRNLPTERKLDVLRCFSIHLSKSLLKNDELLADQLNDSDISKVIHYLKSRNTVTKDYLPQQYRRYIDKLELKDHLLIYKQNRKSFCVVPQDKTEEIMELCHCDWASGHFGLFKTHKRILQRFWWPNCLQNSREFVGNCEICLQIKSPNRKFGALGVREIPFKPLDIVSIDFLTDLPITPQGNVHILVVIDWFSKYLQ